MEKLLYFGKITLEKRDNHSGWQFKTMSESRQEYVRWSFNFNRRRLVVRKVPETLGLNSVSFHFSLECFQAPIRLLGGVAQLTVGPGEDIDQIGFFRTVEKVIQSFRFWRANVHIQFLDEGSGGQKGGPLDTGFQFADIPRPAVSHQLAHGLRPQLLGG